jgi:bisphosphoglycerate-independent phosphoglycerate mutase (AlkP superfamily)
MSVHGVADKTVEILEGGKYPFVVLNLANPDMVILLRDEVDFRWDIQVFMMQQ